MQLAHVAHAYRSYGMHAPTLPRTPSPHFAFPDGSVQSRGHKSSRAQPVCHVPVVWLYFVVMSSVGMTSAWSSERFSWNRACADGAGMSTVV